MEHNTERRLNTFDGVFTPTILTILGVIMYLRLGWVVGNAGLIGALLIIIISHIITFATGLSMASMLSNIRIGAGGAYAIISRSLGLEIGGAIGIPLYLSQFISVSFYIIGFTELWHMFFPAHPVWIVSFTVWLILSGVSLISAKLAFKVQYFVLGAVLFSIVSFLAGPSINSTAPIMWGHYGHASFWNTFAIFFPAATGILAGASMSGELKNPGQSIIKGTLAAIGVGFALYIILAYWFSRQAPENILLTESFIILKIALFKPLIIAGILGAVLSSALSTLVSAPRTLAALANDRIIPASRFLAKKSKDGEPRNAVIVSSLLSLIILLAGSLNALATLLTMFFLTTYGAINLVVFIEQVTGITSFRPRLHLSILVPAVGFIGCIAAMLLIDKVFTIITFLVIIGIYFWLARKNLVSPWGDVRGGIFTSISEWAAQKAMTRPYHPKLWKPSIIVPAEKPDDLRRVIRVAQNIIKPSGRFYYLTIEGNNNGGNAQDHTIDEILEPLKEQNLYLQIIRISTIGKEIFAELMLTLQTLLQTFLPPNIVLLTISNASEKQKSLQQFLEKKHQLNIGVICLYLHPKFGLGQERKINLWLRSKSPNTNLAVLTALQLVHNLDGSLYLLRAVRTDEEIDEAGKQMEAFIEDARLPATTHIKILKGGFNELIGVEPSDITILGMGQEYESMFEIINHVPGTILFVADSGLENALV